MEQSSNQRQDPDDDRGAQLLALVLASEVPRALAELAADAGLPKSTASRLLGALERNGLVEQEGRRGAFRAGPVLARFAGSRHHRAPTR
jgi:DNA-binding IclR family transcriptional regulator